VLVALVPGAAYVSVINDLTDLEDDVASGKPNRLIGRSGTFIAVMLGSCILAGAGVAIYWRNDPLLLFLYFAAWMAFSLYSIPPVRLKARGFAGLLADASGAHIFPTLLVISLVYRWVGKPIDVLWFGVVATWSLSLGLRGILWHQLSDLQNDEKIELRTYVRTRTLTQLRRVGNYVIFPIEIISFAIMLARLGSYICILFLLFYAVLEWSRQALWKMNFVVIVPKDRANILMLEYYEFFFPIALLLSAASRYPPDFAIVVLHLIFFPTRATQAVKDVFKLLRSANYRRFF
jgi:hypothetical protein